MQLIKAKHPATKITGTVANPSKPSVKFTAFEDPTNTTIENIFAKKKFLKNSSIKVKNYLLDKNEKKLIKNSNSIILTEKEVHLIELLLNNPKPLSKDDILSSVWNYSAEADTHTVETHIYRLRKKINQKFMDEEFILNSKDGYHL